MRVAIATCNVLPEPDADEQLLLEALREAGVEPHLLAWDDPNAQTSAFDLVVLRSTWNYFEQVDAFTAWCARVAAETKLLNPVEVVRWNVHKSYLTDLASRGVDVVPTEIVKRGEHASIETLLQKNGWRDVVIKPLVSAGSYRTRRFAAAAREEAQRFLDDLSAERDAMIQQWMPAVETSGERSLVWIDGEITHAIRKSLRLAGGVEQVSEAVPISKRERDFGHAAIDAARTKGLLYGRIDIVPDEDGRLRVMELELVEPSLFFKQFPRALARFVAAIVGPGRKTIDD